MFNHPLTRLSPRAWKTLLAVAVAFTVGASSLAAGLVVSGVVEACYNNTTGALRIATTERPCVTAAANPTQLETPISWNVAGPTGPTGPTGATGATGPAGPAGATRLPTTLVFGGARIQRAQPGDPTYIATFDAAAYKRIRVTVGTAQSWDQPTCMSDAIEIFQRFPSPEGTNTHIALLDRIELCEARWQSRLYELPGAAMAVHAQLVSELVYTITIVGD